MGKPIKPKSDNTREKILVASVKRFSKFGYRRTSINDVAEEAGLARATVYLYWKKKEDLFVAGLERFNVYGRRLAETAAAKKGSAAKRIEGAVLAQYGPAAEALVGRASRRPDDSAGALRRAIALRETIYGIFAAVASHKSPKVSDLDQLNAELSAHLGRLRVAAGRRGFEWTWAGADAALDQPLGPIARAAANLLTTPHALERVRQCEGDRCGWLFVDSTKNHSRRWCVMSDCGNVAKVRRFRLKQRRRRLASANK